MHYKFHLFQEPILLTATSHTWHFIHKTFSAGIGTVNNSDGVVFSVDVPLVGDYNFGCNATPETEKSVGDFIGAGFGYTYTNYSGYFGSGNVSSYGPVVHTGIRFVVSQKF